MAKKKNHTAQNQNKKAHKNGIHKVKKHKYASLKGRDPKFVRNLRYAKAGHRTKALGGDNEAGDE
jgi:large subunit ribosomal protein L29e